jgi:hypothetical protein
VLRSYLANKWPVSQPAGNKEEEKLQCFTAEKCDNKVVYTAEKCDFAERFSVEKCNYKPESRMVNLPLYAVNTL